MTKLDHRTSQRPVPVVLVEPEDDTGSIIDYIDYKGSVTDYLPGWIIPLTIVAVLVSGFVEELKAIAAVVLLFVAIPLLVVSMVDFREFFDETKPGNRRTLSVWKLTWLFAKSVVFFFLFLLCAKLGLYWSP